MQIVDIVTLRPEVELCYMGLARKCYEIIENKYLGHDNRVYSHNTVDGSSSNDNNTSWNTLEQDWTDEEDDADLDDDGNSEDLGDVDEQTEEMEDMDDDDSDDETSTFGGKRSPKLKLREILFYDDKVSIFKARHGHL